jgi:hypothetical protein
VHKLGHSPRTPDLQRDRICAPHALNGPGLACSQRYVDIPDTEPGEIAEIEAQLQAPGYDCTSIAYFKMVDQEGSLCFPDNYQLGLDVLVMVRGQHPIRPHKGGGGRPRVS